MLAQARLPVKSLQFSEPTKVVELDMDDLKVTLQWDKGIQRGAVIQ